jgi:hypothetical protein
VVKRLKRPFATALAYFVEHRRAKAAEDTYHRLSRMSDAELAKHGLERSQIASFIKERLY